MININVDPHYGYTLPVPSPIYTLDPEGQILNINGEQYFEITKRAFSNIPEGKYFVSLDGVIYNATKNTISYGYITKSGYRMVELWEGNNRVVRAFLHVILERVFDWRPGCENLVVNHIDGNPLNNNLDNLELITQQQNTKHAYATGLIHNTGEDNPLSKVTEAQVRALCEYITNGEDHSHETYEELGVKFGMTVGMIIHIIVQGDTWRHVASEYGLPECFTKRSANYNKFTDEDIHKMCRIFVKLKGQPFDIIFQEVLNEMGCMGNTKREFRHKIHKIYYKYNNTYYTRITNQYDY